MNVKNKDGTWRTITADSENNVIQKGDEIKTDSESEAVLVSDSSDQKNQITLKPESEVICEEEGDKIKVPTFNLKQGSAYCSVLTKAKKQGVTFKIQTDVGVAGVTGTEFLVGKNPKGMQVSVAESTVELTDVEGKKVKLPPNFSGYVQPWQKAEIEALGTGMCPTPPGTDSSFSIGFPRGIPEADMFAEAQFRFMERVERIINAAGPEEKQRLRQVDRVKLFREILPQIKKVEVGDGIELQMSLEPILKVLGISPETRIVNNPQPIKKLEYSRLFGNQARLMAQRAAVLDAYRQLAETVHGITISGETQIREFVAENDQAKSQLSTFLQGAAYDEADFEYFSDGIVQIHVYIDPEVAQKGLSNITKKNMGKNML
ncbi:MAG: FecR domain-containing protein, partial [Planctomycetota bacterium]